MLFGYSYPRDTCVDPHLSSEMWTDGYLVENQGQKVWGICHLSHNCSKIWNLIYLLIPSHN